MDIFEICGSLKKWLDNPGVRLWFDKSPIYVKSMEEGILNGFETLYVSTQSGFGREVCQTVDEIVSDKSIKLNTKSFGLPLRLCASIMGDLQTETYRDSGIVFLTYDKPEFISPFDLLALCKNSDRFVIQDYDQISSDIESVYGGELIEDWEKMVFSDLESLSNAEKSKKFEKIVCEFNDFRKSKGFSLISSKSSSLKYNEAVFFKSPRIIPIGIYGSSEVAKQKAKELNLEHYETAGLAYVCETYPKHEFCSVDSFKSKEGRYRKV